MKTSWHIGRTGNHQALVICEKTGKNIAVVYDKADAPLIAASPNLLAALERLAEKTRRANAIQHSGGTILSEDWSELHQITNEAFSTIAQARPA